MSNAPQAGGGAAIVSTTRDSPAAAAGLQPGDVVTTLDAAPVASPDGLTQSLAATRPGQQVSVGWTDTLGQRHTAQVTLGQARRTDRQLAATGEAHRSRLCGERGQVGRQHVAAETEAAAARS